MTRKKIFDKIKDFSGLSSSELTNKELRHLRAEQLFRIRRIRKWSESTDNLLQVELAEKIDIANIWQAVGDDFRNAINKVLEDAAEETKQKIAQEITKQLITRCHEQNTKLVSG